MGPLHWSVAVPPRPDMQPLPSMQRLHKVLVAVDLSSHSVAVIRAGLEHARGFNSDLLLVHVVHALSSLYGIPAGAGGTDSLQEELEGWARSEMRGLVEAYREEAPAQCDHLVLRGNPWNEILNCAARSRVDLIVAGAHTTDKAEHQALGVTVDRVVRNAECPVLVVPSIQPA